MLLLKHTKCYDHIEASTGLDKSIQPAQLLGLSSGPKFCAFQAGLNFLNFQKKENKSDNQIADTQAGLRL